MHGEPGPADHAGRTTTGRRAALRAEDLETRRETAHDDRASACRSPTSTVTYAPPRRSGSLGTGAALADVDLDVLPGEILGIVGETGSGKTTLARATVGLVRPAGGPDRLRRRRPRRAARPRACGRSAAPGRCSSPSRTRCARSTPTSPSASWSPSRSPWPAVAARRAHGSGSSEALGLVGLDADSFRDRYPRQLSGGQRQRVSLARAIVTRPRLLFCDEPVSALDVSNRNLVLRLLDRLRTELGLAVVIIAHDLSSLAGVADRVAVFYRGRLVEQGPIGEVLAAAGAPVHRAAHRVRAERRSTRTGSAAASAGPGRQADALVGGPGACVFAAPLPVRPRRLRRAARAATGPRPTRPHRRLPRRRRVARSRLHDPRRKHVT